MSITFKVNSNIKEEVLSSDPFNIKNFVQDYYKKQYSKQVYLQNAQKIAGLLEKIGDNLTILSSSFNKASDKSSTNECDIGLLKAVGSNSFIHSCWRAYNFHHHLEIRPDDVYMAIMVQFSFYINKHSEALRDRLVDFQGKKSIQVTTNDPILIAKHDELTLQLAEKMKSCIKDPSIASWVIPDFTTTTESDKVAFASVLLSTMKQFFNYSMRKECGLPSVTLLGTVDDWSDLKERLQKLKQFNLEDNLMDKWVSLLDPIVDQLILTALGNPDLVWWESIVDYKRRSGGSTLSGWLSCFACFDIDGNWIATQDDQQSNWPTILYNKIANGFVSVPILLIDGDGTQYNSTLISGHIAATSSKETEIKPSIDWFLLLDSTTK